MILLLDFFFFLYLICSIIPTINNNNKLYMDTINISFISFGSFGSASISIANLQYPVRYWIWQNNRKASKSINKLTYITLLYMKIDLIIEITLSSATFHSFEKTLFPWLFQSSIPTFFDQNTRKVSRDEKTEMTEIWHISVIILNSFFSIQKCYEDFL